MAGDLSALTFADLQTNLQHSTLGRLLRELRLAADNCPNCQGGREYRFLSRGRGNIVPCVRCAVLYNLMEPLEVALEIIRGDSPY